MQRSWFRQGEPMVWLSAGALALTLLITVVLFAVILINGLGVFWAKPVAEIALTDGSHLIGEIVKEEETADGGRFQLRVGNRELTGVDFRWVDRKEVSGITYPEELYMLERMEYGAFFGRLGLEESAFRQMRADSAKVEEQAARLEEEVIATGRDLNRIETALNVHEAKGTGDAALSAEKDDLQRHFTSLMESQRKLHDELAAFSAPFTTADGDTTSIAMHEIVRPLQPNRMSTIDKLVVYLDRLWELFTGEPRESNTEGGLFPAIFGTIMLIFLMSIVSFPVGVIAGVYLREYAKDGALVRLVRIAVNNLAGIPSIVFGIFGLGFFVYGIGGTIDRVFFSSHLPEPTFGTGGILWASLTLALLTIPVVIVATEEALGAIPNGIREGSLALGATKFQTLTRTLLPMASPGIMTGFILAMARAAGEVAPLMITGVVKLAPALPLDGEFPFFHLDRKFMHLGFHIFDIGFQSPNVEAAKPMVYVTAFLLVMIVLVMNSLAITLRNRMKKRYTFGTF